MTVRHADHSQLPRAVGRRLLVALVLGLLLSGAHTGLLFAFAMLAPPNLLTQDADLASHVDCGLKRVARPGDRGRPELDHPFATAASPSLAILHASVAAPALDPTLTLPAPVRRALLQIYLI